MGSAPVSLTRGYKRFADVDVFKDYQIYVFSIIPFPVYICVEVGFHNGTLTDVFSSGSFFEAC